MGADLDVFKNQVLKSCNDTKSIMYHLGYLLPKHDSIINTSKIDYYEALIDMSLERDKEINGSLHKLYNIVAKNFDSLEKILFFQGFVMDKEYDELDLSEIEYDVLINFSFINCKFKRLIIPYSENYNGAPRLTFIDAIDGNKTKNTVIPEIIIPTIGRSSWPRVRYTRIDNTCITLRKNLYIELNRVCNGNCVFCRNKYLEPCEYNLDNIIENLKYIYPRLNDVVVGGGEPTLFYKDLVRLGKFFNYAPFRRYIFTNASLGLEELIKLTNYFRLNISRHAIEDADNNDILGVKSLSLDELRTLLLRLPSAIVTLVATCFEDGLSTVQDLEDYLEMCYDVHASRVMFQTLHKDLNNDESSKYIDDSIFDDFIEKLRKQRYSISELPIYSTGDYKLIIAKSYDGKKVISFKKYISKDELESKWLTSPKRTFDLSMAPNGDIYQNWHQSSDKILIRR